MKTLKLTKENVSQIFSDNEEYLTWANEVPITKSELMRLFVITQYDNCQYNLEHIDDDFRIENIIF